MQGGVHGNTRSYAKLLENGQLAAKSRFKGIFLKKILFKSLELYHEGTCMLNVNSSKRNLFLSIFPILDLIKKNNPKLVQLPLGNLILSQNSNFSPSKNSQLPLNFHYPTSVEAQELNPQSFLYKGFFRVKLGGLQEKEKSFGKTSEIFFQ